MTENEIITTQPEPSCLTKTKLRSFVWLNTLLAPVEYPVTESKGKGWEDPCNCFCGTICFAPKAVLLFLTIPYFCSIKVNN